MKIILCGHSRHGKGEVGNILTYEFGLRSYSSSWVARQQVYKNSSLLRQEWKNPESAWENRHYNRDEWYRQIQRINTPDKTTLAELVFSMPGAGVYDGMRDREELRACQNRWHDTLAVWVCNPTKKTEDKSSNTITAFDCNFSIINGGTLPELQRNIKHTFGFMQGVGV